MRRNTRPAGGGRESDWHEAYHGLCVARHRAGGRRVVGRSPLQEAEGRGGRGCGRRRAARGRLAAAEHRHHRGRDRPEARGHPAARLSAGRPVDARRLCGAGLVRPHRPDPPEQGQGHFLVLHRDLLVRDLCAVTQYRRIGVLGRHGALPRLHGEGADRGRDRGAGGAVLLHLRVRDDPAARAGAGRRAPDPQAADLALPCWRSARSTRSAPGGTSSR